MANLCAVAVICTLVVTLVQFGEAGNFFQFTHSRHSPTYGSASGAESEYNSLEELCKLLFKLDARRSPYIGFPMAKRMPKIEEICGPIIEQKLMKAEAEKVEENQSQN